MLCIYIKHAYCINVAFIAEFHKGPVGVSNFWSILLGYFRNLLTKKNAMYHENVQLI